MQSQVLLINFSDKEAEKVSTVLPVKVARGYLGDVQPNPVTHGAKQGCLADYPPVYEYQVTVVKLDGVAEAASGGARFQENKDIVDLYGYWKDRPGVLIVLMGDYQFGGDMKNLGILEISLMPVSKPEKEVRCSLSKKDSIADFLKAQKTLIKLPPKHYLCASGGWLDTFHRPVLRTIYSNLNGDPIGIMADMQPDHIEMHAPAFMILPLFSDNGTVISGLIQELAKIYPKLLPEINDEEWANSDELYPKSVRILEDEIEDINREAAERIAEKRALKAALRAKYDWLKELLTENGDKLKAAVLRTLTEVFFIDAQDADSLNKTGTLNEDIIIKLVDRVILAEVKGTRHNNPPDSYIIQVWKHLHRSGERDIAEGALILNHDLLKEPSKRSLAYANNNEINDIIFIDTRVLFKITLDVIDEIITPEDAVPMLFKKGRVTYPIK